MKYNDKNLAPELRMIRDNYMNSRWGQLHSLSKETGDSAIKYLFTVNAGGAVAVLAYLGAVSGSLPAVLSAKVSLVLFFIGLLFVGFYKAYMVHNHEGLFKHYRSLVSDYYECKIGWGALIKSDETKVGNPLAPYIFGYISFGSFIGGCISGAIGVL
jgi:hypothetical protein